MLIYLDVVNNDWQYRDQQDVVIMPKNDTESELAADDIAKRYIEANGKNTSILVIYPPALEDNWKQTFKLFGIERKAQFITNGSLHKVLNGESQYKEKEEFDLIIVDEAHGFRSDQSGKYDELQKICKSACSNVGLLRSLQKKVMLLSATPALIGLVQSPPIGRSEKHL